MWKLRVTNILGNGYIPYKTIQEAIEGLHQLRLNGADGYIYKNEK
jgi:hypothetical protein